MPETIEKLPKGFSSPGAAEAIQTAPMTEAVNDFRQRLENKITERTQDLSALYAAMAPLISSDAGQLLQQIVERLKEATGADAALIRILEKESNSFFHPAHLGFSSAFLEATRHLNKDSAAGTAFMSGQPIIAADIATDSRLKSKRQLQEGFKSCAFLPFNVSGKLRGIIHVASREVGHFTEDKTGHLMAIARQMGVALENRELFEESRKRMQEQAALSAIATATSQSLHLEEMLQLVLEKVLEVTGRERAYIRLQDPLSGEIKLVAHRGVSEAARNLLEHRTPGGKCDRIFETGESLIINDPGTGGVTDIARGEESKAIAWIPLKAQGKAVGLINISTNQPAPFTPREVNLLEAIGNVIGVAVANAWLFEETQRQEKIQELLKELSQDITSLDINALFQKVTDKAREFFKADISDIRLLEVGGRRRTVGSSGIESERLYKLGTRRGRSGWMRQNRRALVIPDLTKDTSGVPSGDTTNELGVRGYLAVPLFTRSGEVIGILRALTYEPREFKQSEVDLLQQLANGTAIALTNARLFEETERRARELAALYAVTAAVSASFDLEHILLQGLDAVLEVTDMEGGYIQFIQGDPPQLTLKADRGMSPSFIAKLRSDLRPGGKTEQIMATKRPLVLENISPDHVGKLSGENITAAAWVPIVAKEKVVGVLTVNSKTKRLFPQAVLPLLVSIGNALGVALENARLFDDTNRLVDKLKTTTRQLDAKNKELNTFVYTVSHDLKAPLVSLQGMTELILQEYGDKLDGDGHHYLERLKSNAGHMERLLLDLLALSRVGREGRAVEKVELNEVVDGFILEHGERIQKRGIRVNRLPLPALWGIRVQIEQVLSNLMSNAIKYLGETSSPTIEIGAEDEGETVQFYVKDNGIGIDPAYHEKVFEIFQRLKETEVEGTGVGLSIVKKIVEGVDGRVWVESAKGQGATFYFTWPKTPSANARGDEKNRNEDVTQ